MKMTPKLMLGAFCAMALGSAAAGIFGGSTKPAAFMEDPPDSGILQGRGNAGRARSALMYINHLNHVVAKLNNMDDLLVLQQEYENLTDDNLNLEAIHDESTVQLIVQLMDQLHNLQQAKVRSIQAQVMFDEQKKGAIWKALPQPAMLLVATDPYSLALAVGGAALTSVQNYYNALSEAEKEKHEKDFAIGKDKLAYINEINKELFLSQWRLMRDYGISDRDRVTREDSRLFLGFAEVLKGDWSDDVRRNRLVLNVFRSHEADMRNLPFYWITRAAAAKTLGEFDDLKYSCSRYFALFKDAPIVRRDMDACAMALLYVSVAMKDKKGFSDDECTAIRKWLSFVETTVRIPEWQTKFAVAMIYHKIGDVEKAKQVLSATLDEVYACIRVWETSEKKNNIFRKTPALEKAYADVGWAKAGLPNWQGEAERMVPYDGYVWTAGALFAFGEKHIFDEYSVVDESKCGISKRYIVGGKSNTAPSLEFSNGTYELKSNGLWEPDGCAVVLFVDGELCEVNKEDSGNAIMRFKARRPGVGANVVVSVVTKVGIRVCFAFDPKNLAAEPKMEVKFPWSMQ